MQYKYCIRAYYQRIEYVDAHTHTHTQTVSFIWSKIYELHLISIQIDDQETATKTKVVAIVAATF